MRKKSENQKFFEVRDLFCGENGREIKIVPTLPSDFEISSFSLLHFKVFLFLWFETESLVHQIHDLTNSHQKRKGVPEWRPFYLFGFGEEKEEFWFLDKPMDSEEDVFLPPSIANAGLFCFGLEIH